MMPETHRGAQETTRHESRLVRLLTTVAMAANEAATLEEAAQTCIDEVCALTHWPVGHLYVPAPDGTGELAPSSVWHLEDAHRFSGFRELTEATRVAPGSGLVGKVADKAMPVWYRDVTTEADFVRARQGVDVGVRAGMAFPVMANHEVVGVLEFFTTEPVDPDHRLLEILAPVGTHLGRVVERVRAAVLLHDRGELTRRIIEAADDAFVSMDSAGLITGWNAKAERLFGWSRHEAVGRSLVETVIPPRYRAAHQGGLERFLATGDGPLLNQRVQLAAWHRDDREFPVELHVWAVPTAEGFEFNSFVHDISERTEAERERASLAEHLQLLVESAAEGIYGIDQEGRFTFVNTAAAELFGRKPEELVGRDAHSLVHHSRTDGSPYPAEGCPNVRTVRSGQGSRVESEVMWHKDGSAFPVAYSSFPIRRGDVVEGAVVIFADTTERKRAEEALRRLSVVEDRERIAKDLHDGVIQSLFAVGMNLSATATGNDDPEISRRIEAAVQELDRVIHDVRSYIFSLRWATPRTLAEAVRSLASEFEIRTRTTTMVELDEVAVATLEGRAGEAIQLIREALSNAGRHASAEACRISLSRVEGNVVLEVSDDGRGFDLEEARGRGDGLRNLDARASGLGGRLEIATAPGAGTKVRLVVPA